MKKGFTLIELLAVIVILGIILLVAVPIITDLIDTAKVNSVISSNKMLMKGLDTYIMKNDNVLPNNIGDTVEVSLQTLIDENYISNIESPYTENNCTGYILITKTEDGLTKTPHINCLEEITSSTDDKLVFNYTFDDFQEPTENLIDLNFEDLEIGESRDYGTTVVYRITKLDKTKYELLAVTDIPGSSQVSFTPSITWYDGKYITISAKILEKTYVDSTTVWALSRVGYGDLHLSNLGYQTHTYLGGWFGATQSTGIGFRTNWIGSDYHIGAGSKMVFEDYQAERKEYATPYTADIREGIIKDYSINENNATLDLDTTPRWTFDKERNSGVYEFNGTSSYIEVDNSENINIGNEGTISVFVKTDRLYPSDDETRKYRGIISKTTGGGVGSLSFFMDWMGVNTTRTLRAAIGDATGYEVVSISNFQFGDKWNHLVFTWDSTSMKLYNNGELIGERVKTKTPLNLSKTIEIGRAFNASYVWDGFIDDVKLYDRTLSEKEVEIMHELLK